MAYYHSAVHLFARTYEEGASFLGIEETVSDGLAGFIGDQRTLFAVSDISFVRTVSIKFGIEYTISLGICHKFAAVPDQSPGRNQKFQAGGACIQRVHSLEFSLALAQLVDDRSGKFIWYIHIGTFHRLQFFSIFIDFI